MIAALVSFKSPLATRPMTSTRSSSRLLMAVLFNKTSSGWRSQSKGTFLNSSEGDIIIKFQQHFVGEHFVGERNAEGGGVEPQRLKNHSPAWQAESSTHWQRPSDFSLP